MCVIFFYVNSNPGPGGYKLILASNRDEFYNRETCSAIVWANLDHVFGGVDLEPGREGGTWLAMAAQKKKFKVGALLNLTGEPKPRRLIGRGMIVTDYVNSHEKEFDSVRYNKKLLNDCEKYSGFNFVSIEIPKNTKEPAQINLLSNKPRLLKSYEQGKCYGFGNSLPSAPFEKVTYGTKRFTEIVETYKNREKVEKVEKVEREEGDDSDDSEDSDDSGDKLLLIKDLCNLLKEKTKFWPDTELARRAPSWGEGLSSINVHIPEYEYGSRTHTVILIDSEDKLNFYEETLLGSDPAGKWETTHFERHYDD